ncbi:MAG: polysaccharide deacetylase family protein [Myxococcota bacterium]
MLPIEASESVRGTVPLTVFREQLAWLARRGYRALTLDEAATALQGEGAAPRGRSVVITFDDGYRCVVEHALPVLLEFGMTATMFVVTNAVDTTTDWYVQGGGRPFEHASWPELERAAARGFTIGSHTANHRSLVDASESVVADELGASKETIEKRLGACRHFAYPFGAHGDATVEAVRRAGYTTACSTESGLNRRGQPPLRLRRQSISRSSSAGRFRRRLGAWF